MSSSFGGGRLQVMTREGGTCLPAAGLAVAGRVWRWGVGPGASARPSVGTWIIAHIVFLTKRLLLPVAIGDGLVYCPSGLPPSGEAVVGRVGKWHAAVPLIGPDRWRLT
jgi:hypothetical protein